MLGATLAFVTEFVEIGCWKRLRQGVIQYEENKALMIRNLKKPRLVNRLPVHSSSKTVAGFLRAHSLHNTLKDLSQLTRVVRFADKPGYIIVTTDPCTDFGITVAAGNDNRQFRV